MTTRIFYDGECPFCSKYVSILRLRDAVGAVELVDMRCDPDARARFAEKGLDTDKGMIVESPDRALLHKSALRGFIL